MVFNHNIYDRLSGALWKDENFDVASYRATGAAPPNVIAIPGTSIQTVSFNGNNTTQDISVCKELNHDYRPHTPISFHVHWYPTDTGAGNVKWQIEYWCTNISKPGTVISGSLSVLHTSGGVAWINRTVSFPDLDLGELAEIGTQIHFRFFRNPSDTDDTYNNLAAVATIGFHYQTDSRGSSERFRK